MLKYVIKRELQNYLYSLVFQISFLLITTAFIIGTIVFLESHDSKIQEYSKYYTEFINELKKTAEINATRLAVRPQAFVSQPRGNGFISDCKERYLPNRFIHSAYNVFRFEISSGSVNPFLNNFQELNWSFIVSLIISFVVLLLTFNTISGEKESKTLAITLSNSISRGTLLWGKYIGVILMTMLMLIIGIILGVLIVIISNKIALSFISLIETLCFILISFFFISLISAFGILSSVIARKSNVSLLISLTFWLIFIVIIPNSSMFWAKNIFSIEHADAINEKVSKARNDINRNAPPGSWSSSSNNPFLPEHELRAANQTKLMNSDMNIRNAYYQDMFRQLEQTRLLTMISPVSLFEYINEAVVGGGYLRFQKVWKDLHAYQPQFLQFFKELDANDPDSPHWYNPYESLSTTRKPVNFEQVPVFEELTVSLNERFSFILKYLIMIIIYTSVIFFSSFALFVRYDAR
ncbi:ABC transporter permease subunit [candidate division KSB1 bacterium]